MDGINIIKLKEPEAKNISYNVARIKLTIPVFQLTGKTVDVPVEVINQNIAGVVKLIPGKISIVYQVPINKFSLVDSTQFQAIVDGSQIDTAAKQPLKVQLISAPKFSYNIRLKPDYIDYVREK